MSFGNSGGGTLTIPSPTHPNHIDVQAAVRSLRRSISRSPSKFQLARTGSQSSDASASSTNSQNSSTPASPSLRRMASHQFAVGVTSPQNSLFAQSQTPLATPFRPNVKLSLRSAKSSSKLAVSAPAIGVPKSTTRTRGSPKSPSKRALNALSSNSANSAPSTLNEPGASGQENSNAFRTRSPAAPPASRKSSEKAKNRHSMHLDMSGMSTSSSLQTLTRLSESTSTASPLKRSDATMDLDPISCGSPKAKRRSYGPSSFASDFNVFDHGPTSPPNFDIHDESTTNREYDWTGSINEKVSGELPASPAQSGLNRRAGSLRKSTLSQRHSSERTSWGRRHAAYQLAQASNDVSTPNTKSRPRLSLDHYLPLQQPRDSPFSGQGPLPNPSVHPVNPQPHQPHPLSRTMTTSSSNSSIPDESPTHFPIQNPDKPKAPINWSKSLPLNSHRPTADNDRFSGSVSTPDYKSARPFFGAFASTGLVSKVNRHPEIEPVGRGGAPVPDTPCKRVNGFATYPPIPGSNVKPRGRIHRHTFGAPSTPFGSAESGSSKHPALLFTLGNKHSRKGSALSVYSDDGALDVNGDSQMTTDGDLPPTPTKQQLLTQNGALGRVANDSPTTHRQMPAPLSAIASASWQQDAGATSTTPKTPLESVAPLDASRLSISNAKEGLLWPTTGGKKSNFHPATPTTRQDGFATFADRRAITPTHGLASQDVDSLLLSRFGKVEYIGAGEFSQVYKVIKLVRPSAPAVRSGYFSTPTHHTPPSPSPDKVFAVKKLKLQIKGESDRSLRTREVTALSALRGAEHVVQLIDSWEENNHLYIQTEYCEEGSLDTFLAAVGSTGRLDDFRIWKIMFELSRGLQAIHNAGFVHLDLKPANILINFEGTLKIGDFGMTAALPAEKGSEFEGDREYIALEILRGEIDKPADIFSLGLIMLEISANVKLPENGATWTALREGDFREVPTLTQVGERVLRDATGMPIDETERSVGEEGVSAKHHLRRSYPFRNRQSGDIFGLGRKNELEEPPSFMKDPADSNSLDSVVKWMLAPERLNRPTISQLLDLEALRWTSSRSRAAATVFEGNYGPASESHDPISLDTEMTDV